MKSGDLIPRHGVAPKMTCGKIVYPNISVNWGTIYDAAAETQTALEINADPHRLDLADTRVQAAKESGVRFIISTDSHGLSDFGFMSYGLAMARRGWLEKRDVLNTRTYQGLMKWIEKRRSSASNV